MGRPPPRVGTLVGCMLPFISLGPVVVAVVGSSHHQHSGCLIWGVTFWQSEKLFAAALNLRHPHQCSPRPLRHWYRHHLHSAPRSHLLSPCPLSICLPGPSPSQPLGCGAVAAQLGLWVLPLEPEPSIPLSGSAFSRAPLCPVGLAPWHLPSTQSASASSPSSFFHQSLGTKRWFLG